MSNGINLPDLGLKDLTIKIFGPTADYLGGELKTFTERRHNNVKSILDKAAKKLGRKIENTDSVNPKVFSLIFNEGSFCEDDLSQEYFAGVLAGSRNNLSRDNRGATLLLLINQLSVYHIRAHYIFYHVIHRLFKNKELSVAMSTDIEKMGTYISFDSFFKAMDIQDNEPIGAILPHIFSGLTKENLIKSQYVHGAVDILKKHYKEATKPGIVYWPSMFGVELFLWANGKSEISVVQFFNKGIEFEKIEGIKIIEEYISINNS